MKIAIWCWLAIALFGLFPACDESGKDGSGDSDADSDSDSDTDDESDTDVYTDSESGLMWQDPPCQDALTWDEAVSYCDSLEAGDHDDWRLPNIDELISLLRGCVDGVSTGDTSLSSIEMTPADCVENDNCSGASNSSMCDFMSGPDEDGCYWDPALFGPCNWYWSTSSRVQDDTYVWCGVFPSGYVWDNCPRSEYNFARCVR